MKAMMATLALGAAFCGCGTAAAKPPTAFVQCDGYAKPKAGSNDLVKGKALIRSWSFSGFSSSFNPRGRQPGAAGVAACRTALADPLTAEAGWIRRVTLNQALALHHLEAREPEAALVALDSAVAAAGSNASDTFYRRSTGVSLDILRAIALMRLGRGEEGLAAVRRAASARPWSMRVQMLSLGMLGIDGGHDAEELAVAERLRALNPDYAESVAALYLRSGRHAEAWSMLRKQREKEQPAAVVATAAYFRYERDLGTGLVAAYAAARAGDKEGSRAVIEGLRSDAKAAAAQLGNTKLGLAQAGDPAAVETTLMKPIDRWIPVIESAELLAAGDAAAAQEKLIAVTDWPATPLLAQLTGDIRNKLPPEARKGMVAIEPAELRAKLDGDRNTRLDRLASPELFSLLPEPEDEDQLNSFSGQFGLGLKNTGFKDKLLENGATRIEFVGSVSSPLAVEEMTLLRAARLALQGGRKAFVIEKREDFSRHRQMTMNGVPTGPRTLAGYMTRFEVRFIDDLAQPGAIDAAAVDSTLGPLYARSGRSS